MHNTTPQWSDPRTAETVDERGNPVLQLGEGCPSLTKLLLEIAQLGTHLVQLHLRRHGRGSLHDVGAPRLSHNNAALLFEQPDRGLRRVERDPVLSHQRPVRRQPIAHRVVPCVDLASEQVSDATTRRLAITVDRLSTRDLNTHAVERTRRVSGQPLTGRTAASYCPATVELFSTTIGRQCMDGARYDSEPGEPTAAELAATNAVLPEYQQRVVREYWERLIEECYAQVADGPRPTSWLATRTEEQRRQRRAARRAAGAVVRELPVRRASGPDEREAA